MYKFTSYFKKYLRNSLMSKTKNFDHITWFFFKEELIISFKYNIGKIEKSKQLDKISTRML